MMVRRSMRRRRQRANTLKSYCSGSRSMHRSAMRFCAAQSLRGVRMRRPASWKILFALLWLLPQFGIAADQAAKESAFGVYRGYSPVLYPDQIKTSFYLPMRDGVRLAVDLYRPAIGDRAADGKFPVVWHHTLDRKGVSPPGTNAAYSVPELTKHGYVVALVERRGLSASFGVR